MPWDTTTDLTSPAVSGVGLEQKTLDLLYEFLEGYFSGTSHAVDGVSTDFPAVALDFQGAKPFPTPLGGAAITLTWLRSGKAKRRKEPGKRQAYLRTAFQIWVRAAGENVGDGGPAVLAKRVCDLLYALLNKKRLTVPLARKGIHHVEATNGTLVSVDAYHMRAMTITAELQFPIE
jgi:hypothetical protein